jgi:alanyl-tRNA synthetase
MVVSATKTEKLYWADPFTTTFEAEGLSLGRFGDRPSVILDRTLFYPEAGGQLADTGTLTIGGVTLAIDDVQIDDEGTIHHLARDLASTELDPAACVVGQIDLARRRDHMAQHTAQHALSRALVDVAKADTVSARLGANACTIDVHLPDVAERDLVRVEDLVNAIVMDDVPVRALFPTDEELRAMDLRRTPKVSANVRVIEIADFDLSPCGGTHCTRTGQIGLVRIVGTERYKGKLRVSFHAARRAIDDARKKEQVLSSLAADFTCGLLDVGGAVGKLRADLKSRSDALSIMRGELVDLVAERVWRDHPPHASGTTIIPIVRAKDDVAMLRTLAGRLAARADVVALCISPDDAPDGDPATRPYFVVAQRGERASFDCGAWLKAVAQKVGGRGGGRPERAEGRIRLPGDSDPIDSAALAALLLSLADGPTRA